MCMIIHDISAMRAQLGVSRTEFARFLGVSEATVVRWESDRSSSEPRGLQAILIRALSDAVRGHAPEHVARVLRSSAFDHRGAVKTLLALDAEPPGT